MIDKKLTHHRKFNTFITPLGIYHNILGENTDECFNNNKSVLTLNNFY